MKKIGLPLSDDYLLNLQSNNYSEETLYNYERDLKVFENFLEESDINFESITKRTILNYKAYLSSRDRKTAKVHEGNKRLGAFSIRSIK